MSEKKTYRYYLKNERPLEGWAEVVLCSTGMFAAVSDYGNYVCVWRYHGEKDFRLFVANLASDKDYFMRKVGWNSREYDGATTCRSVKRAILEQRRCGAWSRERARDEWVLLAEHEQLATRADLTRWYDHTHLPDASELVEMKFSGSLVAFAERVLPRLRDAIHAELDAERRAA